MFLATASPPPNIPINTRSKKLLAKETSGMNDIYLKLRDPVVVKEYDKRWYHKNVSTSAPTGIIYTVMHNYSDASLQQYIFEQNPTKQQKYHSSVHLRKIILKGIQFIILSFFQKHALIFIQKHTSQTFTNSIGGRFLRKWPSPVHQNIIWIMMSLKPTTFPHNGFTTAITRNGWRDGSYIWAIK